MINYTRVVKFKPNQSNQVPNIFFITDTDESKKYQCSFAIDGSIPPIIPKLVDGLPPLPPPITISNYGSFEILPTAPHDYPTNDSHEPSFFFDGINFYCPSPYDEKYINNPGLVRYIMNTWMETLVFNPNIIQNNIIKIKLNDIIFPVIITSHPVITISPFNYECYESPDSHEITTLTFNINSDDVVSQDQTIHWRVSPTDLENNSINNFTLAKTFGDTYPEGNAIIKNNTNTIQIQIQITGNTLDIDRNFYIVLTTNDTNIVVDPKYGTATVKIKKFIHSNTTLKYKSNMHLFDYLAPINTIEGSRTGEVTDLYFSISIDKPLIRLSESLTWEVLPTGNHPVNSTDFFNNELPSGTIDLIQTKTDGYNFVIQINQDTDVEFDETFRVAITNYSPGLLLGKYNYADVIIKNDDYSYLSLPNEITVNEGDTLYIPIMVNKPFVLNSKVDWYVSNTKADGTNKIIDFPPANVITTTSGTIHFDPLVSFDPIYNDYFIEIKITNDIIYGDSNFYVNLKNPTGNMKLGNNISTLITINDIPNAIASIEDLNPSGIFDGFVGQITPYPFVINLNRNVDVQQKIYWKVNILGTANTYAQIKDFTNSSLLSGYIYTTNNILSYQINDLKIAGPNKPTKDRTFDVILYGPSNHLNLDPINYKFTGFLKNDHLTIPLVSIYRTSQYSITPPEPDINNAATYINWPFEITTDLPVSDDEWVDWQLTPVSTNNNYPVNISDFYQEIAYPQGRINFHHNVPTDNIITDINISSNNTVLPTRTFQITLMSCSGGISINTNSNYIMGEIVATHFNTNIITNFTVAPTDIQYISEPPIGNVILPFTITITEDVTFPENVFWTVESVGAAGVDSVIPTYFTYSDLHANLLPKGSVQFKYGTKSIDVTDLKIKAGIHLQRNASLQITLSVDPNGKIKLGTNSLIAAIIQPL